MALRRIAYLVRLVLAGSLLFLTVGRAQASSMADFEDLGLGESSYYNGSDGAGSFQSGPVVFENSFDSTFFSWGGFAYSTLQDATTPGWGNQYAAAAGDGHAGSLTYGLFFDDPAARMRLPNPSVIAGVHVTNTAYTALSMRDGDGFAKQFGGASGDDEDWFLLTISGFDDVGAALGSVDFYLADYRFVDNGQDYIVTTWTWVDLQGLGAVSSLGFAFDSSDTSNFGGVDYVNTPTYFAIDSIVVPEPGTWLLVGIGLLGLGIARKR